MSSKLLHFVWIKKLQDAIENKSKLFKIENFDWFNKLNSKIMIRLTAN